MSKQDIQKRLRAALHDSPYERNIQRVSLFGSQLHGNATEESDIDLLIEFSQPMSMFKLVRMERDLSAIFGKKVELSTPMSLSKYFRKDVLQEAEPIFTAAA